MHIMGEVAIIFVVCLVGEGIAAVLPISFPASVISLLLLMALLFSRVLKEKQIERVSAFFVANMGLFFVPSFVGAVEYADTLLAQLVPFVVVAGLTTPLVYLISAWTVQLLMMRRRRKEVEKRG